MKHTLLAALLMGCSVTAAAQKKIYIPEDLRQMDLEADTSKWCWKRSAETRDLIFMWERGFGYNLQNPPQLEGKPMDFNLSVLMHRVQSFYTFFRDTLGFIKPGLPSKADKYKMMVMVNYSLDGTAYGGTYDNEIGALWVAPNRIQDTTMNCMAHELGHSFQAQIMADSVGQCWGGTGFFEMASQWMLWQVNPWWLRDENYHFEAFKTLTHKAYLAMENIYHSPYVIQWWSDLHGRQSIAELFRQGRVGEDPVTTYQRLYGMNQQQFNHELILGYQHLVNFDFKHARRETRPYACTFDTPLEQAAKGWLRPKDAPESYGFNAIKLDDRVDMKARQFHLQLKGKNLCYGFVGVTTSGESIYSPVGATSFKLPKNCQLAHLYLVVMGAPDNHHQGGSFPYTFRITAK